MRDEMSLRHCAALEAFTMQWRPKTTTSAQPQPINRRSSDISEEQEPFLRRQRTKRKKSRKKAKLSRLQKPEGMSLEEWQIELRRQFGREQKYYLKNVGADPIFSEFEVTSPQTHGTYQVQVRGNRLGDNYCSCPDFATNTL